MSNIIIDSDGDNVVIATNKNPVVICAGIQGVAGINGNGTGNGTSGITGFTNGSGFVGNITNSNLSLTLQYANATQSGQLTSSSFNSFTGAVSNVTALQNLTTNLSSGANTTNSILSGATSNITTLQGNVSALNNHTANVSNPHNVTKIQVGLSNVTDVTPLELPVSNATQTALNAKQDTLVSATNIKTINGVTILGSGDMVITGGNVTGIAGFTDGNGFTGTVTNNSLALVLQNANATQSGQVTAGKYTDWESKGTSNLTLGSTGTTALKGNATTADVSASTNKNYVTDANLVVINATSGTNTGDQNLSGYVQSTRTINGVDLTANITLTTANVSASTNKQYVTDANLAVINLTSGTNTGDNSANSLYSGLVTNANHTGDATGSTALTLATVNNNPGVFGNATIVPIVTVNGKGLVTNVTNVTITGSSLPTGLYVDPANQRVGVGTITPTGRLTVKDDGHTGNYIAEVHTDDDVPWIAGFFNDTYSTTIPVFEYFGFNVGNFAMGAPAAKNITFYTNGDANTRLMIAGNGDIGIGTLTAAPTAKLHVKDRGTTNSFVLGVHADDDAPWIAGFFNDTYSTTIPVFEYFGYNSGNFTMGTRGATSLSLYTNGEANTRILISSSGNVGIGTGATTPGALLDVGLAGTKLGVIRLAGSTSGNVSLQPNAVAGSGIVLTLPATTGTIALADSTAWTSYTPTFTGLTVGNATLACAYKQIGKTVFFRIAVTIGSTSTPTATISATLPVTINSAIPVLTPICRTTIADVSVPVNYFLDGVLKTGSEIELDIGFVMATGDKILLIGTYEAS